MLLFSITIDNHLRNLKNLVNMSRYLRNLDGANHTISSWEVRILLSFLLLLLFYPSHAITWEDRGGEAIRLGAVTATTAAKLSNNPNFEL